MDLNPPPPPPSPSPSPSSSFTNFPILAIALLAITVTAFLLVSYYIFVIKCCLTWPHLQSLRRHHRGPTTDESWLAFSSPATTEPRRGLDELVLRDIPTFKYKTKDHHTHNNTSKASVIGERSFRGCAVCLSEFEDQELLRVLPHCGHVFHLDCIDMWLMNNANCPLCRSNISGDVVKRGHIVAPSSSPQEIIISNPPVESSAIEIMSNHHHHHHHHGLSIMGDECISVRRDYSKDHEQPIRRSFSMDSAMDQQLLLQVQQIIRRNRRIGNEAPSSSNGRSSRRSFFSFGSKSAILPVQSDL